MPRGRRKRDAVSFRESLSTDAYAGDWILTRSIVDVQLGAALHCDGTATLETNAESLRYDEAVSFRLGERVIRATRTYYYRTVRDAIAATFADGRPFFIATLRSDGTATAIHQCGDDTYTGRLEFHERDRWQTRWDITGTKAMCITTHYTRCAVPGALVG